MLLLQATVSHVQRDIKELEEKAAASAKAAEYERNHTLELENDLKKIYVELEDEKKTAAHNKKLTENAIKDLNIGLDRCRTGVKVMTQRIFGKLCFYFVSTLCFALLTCCNPSRFDFSQDEINSRQTDE